MDLTVVAKIDVHSLSLSPHNCFFLKNETNQNAGISILIKYNKKLGGCLVLQSMTITRALLWETFDVCQKNSHRFVIFGPSNNWGGGSCMVQQSSIIARIHLTPCSGIQLWYLFIIWSGPIVMGYCFFWFRCQMPVLLLFFVNHC